MQFLKLCVCTSIKIPLWHRWQDINTGSGNDLHTCEKLLRYCQWLAHMSRTIDVLSVACIHVEKLLRYCQYVLHEQNIISTKNILTVQNIKMITFLEYIISHVDRQARIIIILRNFFLSRWSTDSFHTAGFGMNQAKIHYVNRWLLGSLRHICVTRLQWVNAFSIYQSSDLTLLSVYIYNLPHIPWTNG